MNQHSDTNSTIAYYEEHGSRYARDTVSVDIQALREPFLSLVPEGGHILDAGCGSGRDAKEFLGRGYRVTAFDASTQMATLATEFTGLPVSVLRFEDLTIENAYDGIWACASLLHVRRADLVGVFGRLARSLNPGGILYASFKNAEGERTEEGRWFTDFSAASLREFIAQHTAFVAEKIWETADCRPSRRDDVWVNLLARLREPG